MKNEIVLFNDGDLDIKVQVNPEQENVLLSQKQMAELFDVRQATLSEHINNILKSGELDETSIGISDKSSGGRKPMIYNLDMIVSVGYRVNSKRGIAFRRWANNILKDYVLKGYAVNEKRLEALNKTVEIQSRMISSLIETPEDEVYEVVRKYTDALTLLDEYDHQCLNRPEGNKTL
ncbi:MAG: virulence RhuM family protein, partial [Erysipelotrichaceae bacterium]|nr:virulence RhuM family protein [Erysipelotrichaceae bacterium]